MAAKPLFKLFGLLGLDGVKDVNKSLNQVEKNIRRAQYKVDRFGRSISNVGKSLTVAFTAPLIGASAAMVKGIQDATDLNETISKTGEVFGQSAKDIEAWAETSATAMGQSKVQALDAASTFGIIGKSAGMAGEELVQFSTQFTQLASDMASFFNTEPQEAVTAIGAAFRGESEPIRKYGVLLDDATMRQKALELGIISTVKTALTPQNKILAAQALILEKTKTAQGDFARTSGGLANQMRILKAEVTNLSAELGGILLPIATKVMKLVREDLVPATNALTGWFAGLSEGMQQTIIQWGLMLAAIGPVVFALGKVVSFFKILIPLYKVVIAKQTLLNAVLTSNPIGLLITAIAGLVAAFIFLKNNWDTVTKFMGRRWEDIIHLFKLSNLTMSKIVNKITDSILGMISKVTRFLPGVGDAIEAVRANTKVFIAETELAEIALEKERKEVLALREAQDRLAESTKKATQTTKQNTLTAEKSAKTKAAEADAAKRAAEAAKKATEDKKKFEDDYLKKLQQATLTRQALLDIEEQEALRRAEELGADKLNVELFYQAERIKLANEEQQLKFEQAEEERQLKEAQKQKELQDLQEIAAARRELALTYLNTTSSSINKIGNISSKFTSNELKRIDIRKKEDIERIQSSTLSEEQKAAKVAKIEQEAAERSKNLEREEAQRQKDLALFSIVVDTAAAVTAALPNIPLSILIGTLGAAQAVAVAQEPIPFFDGGFIRGSEGGVNAIVGESNQDELVLPLNKGAELLAERLTQKLPVVGGSAPDNITPETETRSTINLNVGTLIGDDRSLKQLYRKLDTIGISENQRKGVLV